MSRRPLMPYWKERIGLRQFVFKQPQNVGHTLEDHKLATEMQEPIILIGDQLISVGRISFGRGINKTCYIVDRLLCNCGHLRTEPIGCWCWKGQLSAFLLRQKFWNSFHFHIILTSNFLAAPCWWCWSSSRTPSFDSIMIDTAAATKVGVIHSGERDGWPY